MLEELFNINFKRLAVWWLPKRLRGKVILNFCFVLIYPIEVLYLEILRKRKQNLIKLNHNFQKFSIQKRLNDAFDPVERRIILVKAVLFDSTYLYTEAEDDQYRSKTEWLYGDEKPIYLYTEAELYSEFDFIVKIPDSNINQIQLKAEIDFYVLQGKNYKIEII